MVSRCVVGYIIFKTVVVIPAPSKEPNVPLRGSGNDARPKPMAMGWKSLGQFESSALPEQAQKEDGPEYVRLTFRVHSVIKGSY